ncbi:unnamed protein product [Echinostoma caproni]|uniref:Reverse transcriptase domain-containing protein n=1 Tax=Echinostoma caproni TaxID=27848 RepID=A0A183B476_9TREM|nr:unnamed protein product [Echinostoma caproni]
MGSFVERSFYVDDFLGSFDSIEEAVQHIRDLSKLLLIGGFKVTKWTSKSRHAIDCIPFDERAPSLCDLQGSPLPTNGALGVQWNSEKEGPLQSNGVRRIVATAGQDSAAGPV